MGTRPNMSKAARAAINYSGPLKVLATANPKRGKSAARFALYKGCTTPQAYINACVKAGHSANVAAMDLCWDAAHNFIALPPAAKPSK
jgi:hypothetical protein